MGSIDEGRQTEKNDWDEQVGFFHGSSKSSIPNVVIFVQDDDRGQPRVYNILYKVTTKQPQQAEPCFDTFYNGVISDG